MKITNYSELIGLEKEILFFKSRIETGNLPKFLMFYGVKGTGKSSLARLLAVDLVSSSTEEREKEISEVILKDKSTEGVKLFNMSTFPDEDIDVVIKEITPSYKSNRRRVVILDEAHRITKKAQDALLQKTEYIPDNVYVILLTTEINSIVPALRDRAIKFSFKAVSEANARQLVENLITRYKLVFDKPKELIISSIVRSTQSPREITNIVEAFRQTGRIDYDELSLLTVNLERSYIARLYYLMSQNPLVAIEEIHNSSIPVGVKQDAVEVLRVAMGGNSLSLSKEDLGLVRSLMTPKSVERIKQLVKMLLLLNDGEITKEMLIGLFLDVTDVNVKSRKEKSDDELVVISNTSNFKSVDGKSTASKESKADIDNDFSAFLSNLKNVVQ